jgi:hypothetical protein
MKHPARVAGRHGAAEEEALHLVATYARAIARRKKRITTNTASQPDSERVRHLRPHEGDAQAGEQESIDEAARIRAKTDREKLTAYLFRLRGHPSPPFAAS